MRKERRQFVKGKAMTRTIFIGLSNRQCCLPGIVRLKAEFPRKIGVGILRVPVLGSTVELTVV